MDNYTDEEKAQLLHLGFEPRHGAYARLSIDAKDGSVNIITIAKLATVDDKTEWSFVWQRGFTYTIDERRAPTLTRLVNDLWGVIFDRSERYLDLLREQARHKVHGGAIYGSVIRVLARDDYWACHEGKPKPEPRTSIETAMNVGDERSHALRVSIHELGHETATETYNDEWQRLIAQHGEPPRTQTTITLDSIAPDQVAGVTAELAKTKAK